MNPSKAHQRCAFASLLLAVVSGASAFYVHPFIAVQNGMAAVLLAICAFGHFQVRPWAYRLTQGVSLLVLLGGFAALVAIGSFGLAVLPNILLLWVIYTNQQSRADRIEQAPLDSAPAGDTEPPG